MCLLVGVILDIGSSITTTWDSCSGTELDLDENVEGLFDDTSSLSIDKRLE